MPASLSAGRRGRARRQMGQSWSGHTGPAGRRGRSRAGGTRVRSLRRSLRKLLDLYGTRYRGQSPGLNMTTKRGAFWGNDLPTSAQKRCPGWRSISRGHSPINDVAGRCQGPESAGVISRCRREIARPLALPPTGTESDLPLQVRYTGVPAIPCGVMQRAWTGRRRCRREICQRYVAALPRSAHRGGYRIRAGVGSALAAQRPDISARPTATSIWERHDQDEPIHKQRQ